MQTYLFLRPFDVYTVGQTAELSREMADAIEQYAPGTIRLVPVAPPEPTDAPPDGPQMNRMVTGPSRRRNNATAQPATPPPTPDAQGDNSADGNAA